MKKNVGQMFLEVVVALGAGVLIATAITVAVTTSLSNTQFSKNQNLASYYATQGIEVIRRIRDTDWNQFDDLTGVYCMGQSADDVSDLIRGPCAPNVGLFIREVEINQVSTVCTYTGGSTADATVTAKWSDQRCQKQGASYLFCHDVKLFTCLSNLYGVSTPP